MSLAGVEAKKSGPSRKHVVIVGAVAAVLALIALLVVVGGGYFYYTHYVKSNVSSEEGGVVYPEDGLLVINVTTSVLTTSVETTSVVASTSISTSVPTTTVRPSCSDGIQNQNETGIDCGGPCLPCVTTPEGIASCLTNQGVILYTRGSICPRCEGIRGFFGNSYAILDVRDCEDKDERDDCIDELEDTYDVDSDDVTFPTWIINGIAHPNIPVVEVQDLSGCK